MVEWWARQAFSKAGKCTTATLAGKSSNAKKGGESYSTRRLLFKQLYSVTGPPVSYGTRQESERPPRLQMFQSGGSFPGSTVALDEFPWNVV